MNNIESEAEGVFMNSKWLRLNRAVSVTIVIIGTLSLVPKSKAAPTGTGCATAVVEQYGVGQSTFGDTPLYWRAFVPDDGLTHPAIVVIHGAFFNAGNFFNTETDQDLVCAGFCVFDIEYRLAPPGQIPGQGADPGRYPEQTDDVATAIRAARNPAPGSVAFGRVNGKVGAVGGSAGAAHAAYCAAAPTLGGDQLDAAVLLSGAYDFHDAASLLDTRCGTFGEDVRNYVGCSPGPTCDSDGGLLDLASPYRRFTSSSSPVYIVASNLDPMPPNQFTILVNKVAEVGVPNCQNLLVQQTPGRDGCTQHSFDLWNDVKDQAIAFLNTLLQVQETTPTPTPTASATATPTITATPVPTVTPTPTVTSTPVATATPIATPTPRVIPTPRPLPTPRP
jgi:acetyl esterase/lipase